MNNSISKRGIITSILLAVMLVMASLGAQHAYAADKVYSEGYLKYTISNGSITIIEYFGKDKTVTVPNQIAGTPVNTIGKGTFVDTPATKVKLPDTITTIQEGAIGSGVSVVYNANTDDPQTTKPETPSADGDKGDSNKPSKKPQQTVVINKGQKVEINKKTYTVTKGVEGSTLKGAVLKDKDGNEYTVNKNGELVDEDGNVVGEIPEGSFSKIESADITYDEADVTLDDEDLGSNLPMGAMIGIIVAVVAAIGAAVYVFIRRKRK